MGTITCICVRSVRDEREEDYDKGRVTSGHQSSFELCLSLVHTLKVLRVGLRTQNVRPEFFALHWRTTGKGWKLGSLIAARNVFFDLIELDASHFLDKQADARGEVPNPVGALGGSVLARPPRMRSPCRTRRSDP